MRALWLLGVLSAGLFFAVILVLLGYSLGRAERSLEPEVSLVSTSYQTPFVNDLTLSEVRVVRFDLDGVTRSGLVSRRNAELLASAQGRALGVRNLQTCTLQSGGAFNQVPIYEIGTCAPEPGPALRGPID